MQHKIVIVHHDPSARRCLETICSRHHQAVATGDVKTGLKMVLKLKPALVVVGLDGEKREALELLRYMKHYGSTTPAIVVAGRGGAALQVSAMKAGAGGFLEYPVDQDRFDREISKVLQAECETRNTIPEITSEEEDSNRTEMENRLNRRMQCVHGKNQVHLQSLIIGLQKTKPRISLKCPLRTRYGMTANVYYEYIRDVCCCDPQACPAVQQFEVRESA